MAKKKSILKKVLVVVAAILVVGIVAGAIGYFVKKDDKEKTLGASAYSRYVLSDETGKADKDDKSGLTTDKYLSVDEIKKIELAKDAEIVYQLNYFNKEKEFVLVETLEEDCDFSEKAEALKSEGITYVRIEILPKADADNEVGVLEKNDYVKQLKVTLQEVEEKEEESAADSEASEVTSESAAA